MINSKRSRWLLASTVLMASVFSTGCFYYESKPGFYDDDDLEDLEERVEELEDRLERLEEYEM